MRKGLVIVIASRIAIAGLAIAGLGALPAAAELVPGGWAEPIPVPPPQPPPQPPLAEPAAQRPLAPPSVVHAPVRRRVHRPVAPVSRPSPDGKVQF